MFRADLRTYRTPRTQRFIDFYPLIINIKGRTGQFVDTVLMVFAFIRNAERFSSHLFQALCIQYAFLLCNYHRNTFEIQGILYQCNAFFNVERFYRGNVLNPQRCDKCFNGDTVIPINPSSDISTPGLG